MDHSPDALPDLTPPTESQSVAATSEGEEPSSICYPNWKPMPLPPHDLIDIEKLADDIKKRWFKADYRGGFLYDETGKVNSPIDNKGLFVVDPVTRTRLEDSYIELKIMWAYLDWIVDDAMVNNGSTSENSAWLRQLFDSVKEDYQAVADEFKTVVGEERKKLGLSDFPAWVDQFQAHETRADKRDNDDGEGSQSAPSGAQGDLHDVEGVHPGVISEPPDSHASLDWELSTQPQLDENTPLISHIANEAIHTYCCGCCTS